MSNLIVIEESKWDELVNVVGTLVKEVRAMVKDRTQPEILTHKEAAAYLGYSSDRLHDLKNERRIPYSQCGRKISYRLEDLDQFLEEHKVKRKPYT